MVDPPPCTPPAARAAADISVVIPIFNEAFLLADSARKIASWLEAEHARWELWLIDDGSTDGTRAVLEQLRRSLPGVRLDGFAHNRGRGAALRRGLRRAQGRVVVTTESDGSWEPAVLGELARIVLAGRADVAIASPHRPGGRFVAVPWQRRLLSEGASWLIRAALGPDITMATGATRAYRAQLLPSILSPLDGKAFHVDTLCRALRHGARVLEVPARVRWPDPTRARRRGGDRVGVVHQIAEHLVVLGQHAWRTRAAR